MGEIKPIHLTQQELWSLFDYKNGELFRKNSCKGKFAGAKVGCLTKNGYVTTNIDNNMYYIHRLVWKMFHGKDPLYIDHIDGDRTNNNIKNIRECTVKENTRYSRRPKTNTSGYKGVRYHTPSGKWQARIVYNYKEKHIGLYSTAEEAFMARIEFSKKVFGEFHHDG